MAKLPPPDQLPAELSDAQIKAIIKHGIINPNYEDKIDEVLRYEYGDDGTLKVVARDGEKTIEFEINGDEMAFGQVLDSQRAEFAESTNSFLDRLKREAQPGFERMATTISGLLDSSADLIEFREKLDNAYPDLDGETLTGIMAEAMFAGKLAGVFEAERG
jgi:phage gp29-like protein